MSGPIRIVVLGKTGTGKSSLANTIFGEKVFKGINSANSVTSHCESFTKEVHGHLLKWIDTPGFFDTGCPEEKMKAEILKCITECHPGPHVFLIVLKVERHTKHEQEVISQICDAFSDQAYNFAIVLFTHGDNLEEDQEILDFANDSASLQELLRKCAGRCHVIDNKYWNQKQIGYRSNEYQLKQLFQTMDEMIKANNGQYYTNTFLEQKMFQAYQVAAGVMLMAFLGRALVM